MGLFTAKRDVGDAINELVPGRAATQRGSVVVTEETALKASALWASVRLRADIVSTMPLKVKRFQPDGSIFDLTDGNLPIYSIGGPVSWEDWCYSTQTDLDVYGNTFGIIDYRGGSWPQMIELAPADQVTVRKRDGKITYKIGSKTYTPDQIWHERQYTVSGHVIGLSPLHYAAMTLGQNLSALQFGLDYFGTGGLPTAILKNNKRIIKPPEAKEIKDRYKETTERRDVFVTGIDWELDIQSIRADEAQFLNTLDASAADIARFFGVPADIIDVGKAGSDITYANITQRFLELLVLHIQPALVRRERMFTRKLLPNKQFAEFDTSALLRLDPVSFAAMATTLVAGRIWTPDEVREAFWNKAPLTPEQIEQIHDLISSAPLPAPAAPKLPAKPEG